jgi:polysaccharide biosynthesis protein PslG
VVLAVGLALCALAVLGAMQWRARDAFLTRGWMTVFPEPVADTPGAAGTTVSRACVNAPLDAYSSDDLPWALDAIAAHGFAWVRQRISWAEVEPVVGARDWSAMDAVVYGVTERGLELLAVLDDAPHWALGDAPAGSGTPPDPAAYAAWAGAVADRYGDVITYYQIWHNPNLGDSWGGAADPFGYTAILAAAAEAIRAVDPDARIVLGSLAPTAERGNRNYSEPLFLDLLYDAGAGPYFDVVGAQPYGFHTGPEDRWVAEDVLNFSRAILLREALEARGEGTKAVWATHFGWNSLPKGWPGPPSIWGEVDEATQARYTAEALARVEREWPWMGPVCINGWQPRPADPARAVPDAQEHWGFTLIGPHGVAGDGALGPGAARPVATAIQAWASQAPVARPGVHRADTPLAVFDGTWTLGPQGADIGQSGDRVTLVFEGTDVALTVRRGPYRAFLFAWLDGAPAPALPRDSEGHAYVVLYDPLSAVATVPLAEGLPSGRHTVEIVAERGWGQWALADWRVAHSPPQGRTVGWGFAAFAALGVLGLVCVAWAAPKVAWRWLGDAAGRLWWGLSESARVAIAVVVTALTLFSVWQTLLGAGIGRRIGLHGELLALLLSAGLFYLSPWVVAALVAGAVMATLVIVDPALGLALTLAVAPLYLHPLSLFGKSFSLAELVLLPTLVGSIVWFAGRGRQVLRDDLARIGGHLRSLGRPVLLLVLVGAAAILVAGHRREALREWRLVVMEPALLFLALVVLPLSRSERWRIVDAWVLSALGVALIGLVQFFLIGDVITAEGGIERLRSIYGSPNNVALYLGRVLPVLLAVGLWGGGRDEARAPADLTLRGWVASLARERRRLLYLCCALPIGLALGLSLSRGAIVLGVPMALVTLGGLAGGRWRRATLIVLAVGGLALIPLLRTPRFADMLDPARGTAGFRVALWHSSLELIRDHPLLGVGPDNFLYAYRTRYVLPTAWEEFNLSHPHNVALEFATRLGVVGLAAFIWSQVAFWRRALPLRRAGAPEVRALGIGLAASMAGALAHGAVDAFYFVIDLAFVYMLSLAMVTWLDGEPSQPARRDA